jgi:hypothetical protein
MLKDSNWREGVEQHESSAHPYYVVIPQDEDFNRDPHLAVHLRKWLLSVSVLLHLQIGATPILLIPLMDYFDLDAFMIGNGSH